MWYSPKTSFGQIYLYTAFYNYKKQKQKQKNQYETCAISAVLRQ